MRTIISFAYKSKKHVAFFVRGYPGYLYVTEFKDGILKVEAPKGCHISTFAEVISGCYQYGSNFKWEIRKAFGLKVTTPIKGIKCVFNDIEICTATKENNSTKYILNSWNKQTCC